MTRQRSVKEDRSFDSSDHTAVTLLINGKVVDLVTSVEAGEFIGVAVIKTDDGPRLRPIYSERYFKKEKNDAQY